MTAINLPGQVELPIVVDHNPRTKARDLARSMTQIERAIEIANLLNKYEERPTSDTWGRIQAIAAEILK